MHILKTGCTFKMCVSYYYYFFEQYHRCLQRLNFCVAALHKCPSFKQANMRRDTSTYVLLSFGRTVSRGQTHDQQMDVGCFGRVACLCVGARVSYLCCHEYVIKLPLRKDDMPRQGVHEAGSWVLFVSAESLLWALSYTESVRVREQRRKDKHRETQGNGDTMKESVLD